MSSHAIYLADVLVLGSFTEHVITGLVVSAFALFTCYHLARYRKKWGEYDFTGFICMIGIIAAIVYWWLEHAYVRAGISTVAMVIGITWILISESRRKETYIKLK